MGRSGCAARGSSTFRAHIVRDHARQRGGLPGPGRGRQHFLRVGVSRLPAGADARRGKINILGVILALDARRDQVHELTAKINESTPMGVSRLSK